MIDVDIRWLIRRDINEVLDIERDNFGEHAWTEDNFKATLLQRNIIGMVAENNDRVLGFMVYELFPARLNVLNFAVDVECQRQGVGRAMAKKLIGKLHQERRVSITLTVRDRNLGAQLFWKAMGFQATEVFRGYYENGEDAYLFVRRVKEEALV